jgi:hypothetical protein
LGGHLNNFIHAKKFLKKGKKLKKLVFYRKEDQES